MINTAFLVEDCAYISLADIKRDLGRSRRRENGISGTVDVSHRDREITATYWFDSSGDETIFVVSLGGDSEPQHIPLSEQAITFGSRSFFVCDCGARVCKLFLPPGEKLLKCRSCYQLRYEVSTFNRNSLYGARMYVIDRQIKLANQRANMTRIFYQGRYTQRFRRFLALCEKAGFTDTVRDAQNLLSAIQAQ